MLALNTLATPGLFGVLTERGAHVCTSLLIYWFPVTPDIVGPGALSTKVLPLVSFIQGWQPARLFVHSLKMPDLTKPNNVKINP